MAGLYAAEVTGNTREDLIIALSTLGENDADFCGDNGTGYLWNNVDPDVYGSNLEYLLDQIKDIESDEDLIKEFFEKWIGHDSYYGEYSTNIIFDDNKIARYISLSF